MRTNTHVLSLLRTTTAALVASAALITLAPASATAAVVTPTAKGDCGSGYFCVWTGANYTGSIQRISTTNSYRPITLSTTKSYYNHRSYRTWLHSSPTGGGSTLCINPGGSNGTTSGWQSLAEAAYLATITNC